MSEPVGPVDGRKVPRFAGSGSFGRLPEIDRVPDYDVAVLGAPFDNGTSYRPGARFGPMAVRQASRHLRPGHHVELDTSPFTAIQVVDAGDVPVTPFSIDEAMTQIAGHAGDLLQGDRKVIAIGGDHTIALPMLRSVVRAHGPVALVHFDAHLDTWDTYFGAPYTHGTPFRRAVEEGLLALDSSAHVGVRGPLYSSADLIEDAGLGFATVSTAEVARHGVDQAVDRIRERVGSRPVYLSVDIDVLDPAHAPGTGTPEPGGLTSRELQFILRGLDGLRLAG
ncbi:MAG TPA: agmatinase, partial [Streptosporangiaceae bacterium]|nr:agmatinase [Streptosporangiaceae bacterium]